MRSAVSAEQEELGILEDGTSTSVVRVEFGVSCGDPVVSAAVVQRSRFFVECAFRRGLDGGGHSGWFNGKRVAALETAHGCTRGEKL